MKPAGIAELRKELKNRDSKELIEICLRLARFKKDNKELLSYLLFDSSDEQDYVNSVKYEIDDMMDEVNTYNIYYAKKGLTKIQRNLNKYIRYSAQKQTEVEILIYFLQSIKKSGIAIHRSSVISNMYDRLYNRILKALDKVHEDVRVDYQKDIEEL